MSKRDYYEVLGVSRRHRSRNQERVPQAGAEVPSGPQSRRQEAEDHFKEAAEAYAVLADAEKRHLYDRFGHAGVGGAAGGGGFDPTIFTDF